MDHASLSSTRLSMSPNLQRALHWSGSGLALIGIAFLAWRLHEYWGGLDFSLFTASAWASVIVLVFSLRVCQPTACISLVAFVVAIRRSRNALVVN